VDTEFVIASNDPVAADAVGATMMGFSKDDIPTCGLGAKAGIGRNDWDQITIVTPGGSISWDKLPVRQFRRPKPPLGSDGPQRPGKEESWIGPIRLVAHDSHCAHAGPESTLYGVLSFIRPLSEVYMVSEWQKLRGLTIVYGALIEPVECEVAMLFGDDAIRSQRWMYASQVWQVPGKIPNLFLEGFEDLVYGADADIAELLVTALRMSKGDYL
jgi:hypothetical protein